MPMDCSASAATARPDLRCVPAHASLLPPRYSPSYVTRGGRRGAGPQGFTLLELIVTITVLGSVLAIAAPTLPTARSEDDAVTRNVVRILDRARIAAAERGGSSFVTFDFETGIYVVWIDFAAGTVRQGAGSDSILATGALGGRASNGRYTISFDPFGRAVGGPVPVGSAGHLVEVDPWTGRSHVTR